MNLLTSLYRREIALEENMGDHLGETITDSRTRDNGRWRIGATVSGTYVYANGGSGLF